jgi:hypothetical protein
MEGLLQPEWKTTIGTSSLDTLTNHQPHNRDSTITISPKCMIPKSFPPNSTTWTRSSGMWDWASVQQHEEGRWLDLCSPRISSPTLRVYTQDAHTALVDTWKCQWSLCGLFIFLITFTLLFSYCPFQGLSTLFINTYFLCSYSLCLIITLHSQICLNCIPDCLARDKLHHTAPNISSIFRICTCSESPSHYQHYFITTVSGHLLPTSTVPT